MIGLIAILIGLLLPALARARRQAQTVQCMSNLRQIGQALKIYEIESQGWIFPVTNHPTNPDEAVGLGLNMAPHERWPMVALKVPSAPMPPTYTMPYSMARHLDPEYDATPYTPPVCRCPTDPEPAMGHTYLLNNHLASHKIKAGRHGFAAKTVSDVVVAGEKISTNSDYLMEAGDFDETVNKYGSSPICGEQIEQRQPLRILELPDFKKQEAAVGSSGRYRHSRRVGRLFAGKRGTIRGRAEWTRAAGGDDRVAPRPWAPAPLRRVWPEMHVDSRHDAARGA